MITWNVREGVVESLFYHDENVINPWGVETADAWGFFSLEKGIGYRHIIEKEKHETHDGVQTSSMVVDMPEGKWQLAVKNSHMLDKVQREVELLPLKESWHMDFVQRYRFKKSHFKTASIAGKKIEHTNSNVYYQYSVNEATLTGSGISVRIKILESLCPKNFKPMMYVRDFQDEWVVHIRFLPIDEKRLVIKLCNRWYKTKPIAEILSSQILKNSKLKDYLLYHSEREPYKNRLMRLICPNAFPMGLIRAPEKFFIKSECQFYAK